MSNTPTDDIIISPADDTVCQTVTFEPPTLTPSASYPETDEPIHPNQLQNVPPQEPIISHTSPSPPPRQPQQMPVHRMPTSVKSPNATYYCPIEWGNGFDMWDIVRFSTPMDGSCLFHAISNSFFEPYHTETLNGKRVTRNQMVAALRKELSHKLESRIANDANSPRHYDILNGGNTAIFAEAVPEFSLKYMQEQLDSRFSIGYGYMEFIGNALNKDIYILEAARRDIYVTDELPLTIKGDRRSIILYYMNGHYELVGIHNQDGTFDTHFSPDHSLIRFLHNRVQEIVSPPSPPQQ